MKYLEEYRDNKLASNLINEIIRISRKPVRFMEVCGGHTMAIRKFGIHKMLPPNIELLSGPGCPVCVTERSFIDKAILLSKKKEVIITTYGDLIRVPGTASSLDQEKSSGADVRIIYSTLEALKIAEENPQKKVVFPGIGFETTTPSTAVAVLNAKVRQLQNFFILSAHKIMPPAMEALIKGGADINGYIGPGHVSTIAGSRIYDKLSVDFNISVVISGFEPLDILQSLLMLVEQQEKGKPSVDIQYKRAVNYKGNLKAQKLVESVFETCNTGWRGIGNVPDSGLKLKDEFSRYNAELQFELEVKEVPEPKGCLCGNILSGKNKPQDCKLFGKICVPENPIGACMVSSEGTCAAYYRYNF
ncbi:MAG: hydrogenase formation protein HypD [Bacteroidales bacterium]|nr:hydrogenase formation protein HypD [Bacteroidales bacterium]MBN2818981.1 hydrogenase formation protein HypD [Bacteroidales bacterium]